jgi:hypothetical protein
LVSQQVPVEGPYDSESVKGKQHWRVHPDVRMLFHGTVEESFELPYNLERIPPRFAGRAKAGGLDVEEPVSLREFLGDVVAAGLVFTKPVVRHVDDVFALEHNGVIISAIL